MLDDTNKTVAEMPAEEEHKEETKKPAAKKPTAKKAAVTDASEAPTVEVKDEPAQTQHPAKRKRPLNQNHIRRKRRILLPNTLPNTSRAASIKRKTIFRI